MRKGLAHAGAWLMATSAAVAMSWFGVHHVLTGTAYDPPRALPISNVQASLTPSPTVTSSAPQTPARTPKPTPTRSVAASVSAYASASADNVHSYSSQGGRVVLSLGSSYATLVSATPNSGWRMQVWKQDEWIRVTFTAGSNTAASTVFCTWNGHPPQVQTYDN
ncbi:hypothetical protein OG607_29140 [Streptomyces sp. NBC_01537]|uniref:hypothetical protein n=1 Tax=Streptomyces sp. NBC_01537 TaxID=2903896 RepID=UPI0038653B16